MPSLDLCLTFECACRHHTVAMRKFSRASRSKRDSRAPIDAQLIQAMAQRLAVAKVTGGKPVDADCNLRPCSDIRHFAQPIIEKILSRAADLMTNVDHRLSVTYNLHWRKARLRLATAEEVNDRRPGKQADSQRDSNPHQVKPSRKGPWIGVITPTPPSLGRRIPLSAVCCVW